MLPLPERLDDEFRTIKSRKWHKSWRSEVRSQKMKHIKDRTVIRNNDIRSAANQMLPLKPVNASVLVNLIAGDTDRQPTDCFDGFHFRRPIADRGDLIAP